MTGPDAPALYAILGAPVGHSVSPAVYRAAFAALDVDAVYGALEVEGAEVEACMRALARQGGGNVTLPHKERAAAALDRGTEGVEATGACNCFWGEEGRLVGDNTDVEGFLRAAAGLRPGTPPVGDRVLLLGAGGGARAVLHGCLRAGARRVDVSNRTVERAERMVEEVTSASGDADAEVRVLAEGDPPGSGYDLVVNATSLGLEPGDRLPLELEGLDASAALDLVYARGGTRWIRHARSLGLSAMDGQEMLVRQAEAALERWFDGAPPTELLRQAARASLEER